jgi:hypothetical protein
MDSHPCICTAPTPGQALVAIGDWFMYDKLRLYKTNDNTGIPAHWVEDYYLTREHRHYSEIEFHFINEVSPDDLIASGVKWSSLVCIPEALFSRRAKKLIKQIHSSRLEFNDEYQVGRGRKKKASV